MVSENNRIKRHCPSHTLAFQAETVTPYRISHNKKPGNIPSIIPIPEGPLININRPPSGDISVSTLNNFCPYQTYSINLSFFSSKVASY